MYFMNGSFKVQINKAKHIYRYVVLYNIPMTVCNNKELHKQQLKTE